MKEKIKNKNIYIILIIVFIILIGLVYVFLIKPRIDSNNKIINENNEEVNNEILEDDDEDEEYIDVDDIDFLGGPYYKIYNNNNKNEDNYYIAKNKGYFTRELDEYYDEAYEKENIYNKDMVLLVKDVNSNYVSVDKNGYLNVADDKTVTVYDSDGNVVRKNYDYNVIMLIDDYIVTIKDKKLILATTEGEEIELGKYNGKTSYIDKMLSISATSNGFSGVVPVAKDKYVVYVIDKEDYIAYYYIPETGKKGTTSCSSKK